jgi:hypothetical protein
MPAVRRISRSTAEAEPDERPRRRAREEEPEDEPVTRRRRVVAEEEPDDEPPARRRRPRDDDEEPEARPRRSRPRDDEDEPEDAVERSKTSSVREGWSGYKENKSKGGDFAEELKVGKEKDLIKFLEDEPFTSYRQHWVENPPAPIKKKSWTCVEVDCPLCDTGDRPRLFTAFNILHLNTGADPENKILLLGTKATGQLLNFSEDRKTGPLTKMYYAVSKGGKDTSYAYTFQPIKDRDLIEDWDMDPLSDEELDAAEAQLYDKSIVIIPSRKQLRELADSMMDDED